MYICMCVWYESFMALKIHIGLLNDHDTCNLIYQTAMS